MIITTLIPAVVAAFVISVVMIGVCLQFRDYLPVDHPNHRSLHIRPTPRIGGVGIMAALAVLVWGFDLLWGLVGAAWVLAVVSFLDDRSGLPVTLRFACHIGVAGAFLWVQPLQWWMICLLLPVMVWMTNLYNFMDGADGLAGGQATLGFSAYCVVAAMVGAWDLAIFSGVIAAAALGFLLYNFPPARIFMGDVGSIPIGFLAGGIGIQGWIKGAWPAWFGLLVFAPFVVDATVTLLKRLLRGEKIWQAHREHYYQRLVLAGWSRRKLAALEYAIMLGCAGLAVMLSGQSVLLHWEVLGLVGLFFLVGLLSIERYCAQKQNEGRCE